jgi:UDP-N-acetylglucosamine 4,6-dehydratase/5-epimerase
MDLSKTYLITGGSGFLGLELIKRLTDIGCKNLISVSRNEGKSVQLKELFPHVEIILGDISDQYISHKACNYVDGIFHLAAFKHVGLAEKENVRSCVLDNIQGTLNILEESRKRKVDFVIGISSDKAAQVKGVYGATKFIMERLFSEYEITNPATKYFICRYGNVLYSTGSVLCKWKDKMIKGQPVTITDENATRFFWTVRQAVDLIFDCLSNAKDSSPFITPMKSIRLGDLLEAMMNKYGRVPVETIGMQIGENLHESITSDGVDSFHSDRYTLEEINEII